MYNFKVLIISLVYSLLSIILILDLIPQGSPLDIRLLFIALLLSTHYFIFFLVKRIKRNRALPYLYIVAMTFFFFIILGKFARLENTVSITISIICSIGLILTFLKTKAAKYAATIILISIIVFFSIPGKKIHYISRVLLANNSSKPDISSYYYYSEEKGLDSKSFYNSRSKLSKWYDKKIWNIDEDLPIRGKIYYPESKGIYPLIVIVHGNNLAEIPSDTGYLYLMEYLAQDGYIVASIDQNFLNGNWTTLGVGYPKENDTRAHLLNKHIEKLVAMNNDPDTPFHNSIDIKNIGIIGHSRGGEAAAIATTLNRNFEIKGIASLAPTYRQYPATINIDDISYLTIHGSNDGDLRTFKGRRQYNRVRFKTSDFNLKCSYYIEGVNHNQFNRQWNKIDSTSLGKLFYNRSSSINRTDQEEIAKVLTRNFFDIILKNEYDKIDNLRYPLKNKTLPKVQYITDYSDSRYQTLFSFNRKDTENISCSNIETDYVFRNNNKSLKLSWQGNGSIDFRTDEVISANIGISIASDQNREVPIKISLFHNDRLQSVHNIKVAPIISKSIMKVKLFDGVNDEYHYQFYDLGFDKKIKWNKIVINTLEPDGSLYVDNLGYSTLHQRTE